MTSLLQVVRTKFLEAIRSVNPPGKWKILVVDEHSQRLLGSVLKQFDILEENVTSTELITNNRDPQPGFEAMYLLMPTTQNVDRVIRDFGNRQQYAAAHLFFIDGLDEPLFQRLTSSAAEPHLRALQELFINFWAVEAQTFSINQPAAFFNIYSPPKTETAYRNARDRLEEHIIYTSKCIANVCIALNEYPYIRYYMPSHHLPLGALKPHEQTRAPPPPENSTRWRTNLARGDAARAHEIADTEFISRLLAFRIQQTLDEYKKANPDFPKTTAGRPRGTLLITDRAMDMIAPFVHEFTYQAMANDLLPIQNGTKYIYKFQSSVGAYEDKTATLSDADTVWTEVRHMHMREAIDKLMADFNKFMQENAGFSSSDGAASLNDMKDMLANLPQYQEMREKFSLHLNMAEECMKIFETQKLPLVAQVEQECATGLTAEGKTPKGLVEEMVPLLDGRDVINPNKVRMIALYIQHREGVPDEDRRRLYQHARLSLAEQDAVNALLLMGVRISRTPADKDIKKKLKPAKPTGDEYELSRFKPLLHTVLEEHVSNKLDQSVFPYVKDMPVAPGTPAATSLRSSASTAGGAATPPTSLRSAKPSWHRAARPGAGGGGAAAETRQRLLVFVAGGMTYSEIREAYQLSSSLNKDIIIGSTHAVTPRDFIDDLKVLDLGGVGSRAIPNGLSERGLGERPFQEYYDELYFTQDAPRAPPPQQLAPPRAERPSRMSPSSSFSGSMTGQMGNNSSYSSLPSPSGGGEKEKKKKKGLFRF